MAVGHGLSAKHPHTPLLAVARERSVDVGGLVQRRTFLT